MNPRLLAGVWEHQAAQLREQDVPPALVENFRRFFWIGAQALSRLQLEASRQLTDEGFELCSIGLLQELDDFVEECNRELFLATAQPANERPA